MIGPEGDIPGAIVEPLWSYVVASYGVAGLALAALAAAVLLQARRWARAAAEARGEARDDGPG